MSYYGQSDWFFDVKIGIIPKFSSYLIKGKNTDVDTSSEFVNDLGTLTLPTTYRIHNIVSTNGNDTAAGTGARTVRVYGNTTNGLETDDVTMNGLVNVATVKEFDFIYCIEVLTSGSGTNNAGVITATAQTDATVTIQMPLREAEAYNGAFKIPTGYTGYVTYIWGDFTNTGGTTASVTFEFYKKNPTTWHLEDSAGGLTSGNSLYPIDLRTSPMEVVAGDIFAIKAVSSQNNSVVRCRFTITLKQD